MKLTIDHRLNQLKSSLDLIEDYLTFIDQGKEHYFIALGSAIRALICVGEGRNSHPLLLELADHLKFPILCYGPSELPISIEGLQIRVNRQLIGIEKISPTQKLYRLEDWLQSNFIVYRETLYTPNEVLKYFADKESAHFDPELPKKYVLLKEFKINEISEIKRLLYQTAIFLRTIRLGLLKILKEKSNRF